MALVIYKLGGSLLELDDWPVRLSRLWNTRPLDERRLLIVGGGAAADLVREWDGRFSLGEEAAHELALESLRLTEQLAARLLPGCRQITSPEQVLGLSQVPGLISVKAFLECAESEDRPVPRHWEFTTDAGSAWIGGYLHADELVLLKSASLRDSPTLEQLAEGGLIDLEFSRWAGELPQISWCNLRSDASVSSRIVSSNPESRFDCRSPSSDDRTITFL
jgi:aspartokinase-like uncharacterized kinase